MRSVVRVEKFPTRVVSQWHAARGGGDNEIGKD
jgi:hypothetical protein